MPKSKGITVKFYDRENKEYSFFGRDDEDCTLRARRWSTRTGIKLHRRRTR